MAVPMFNLAPNLAVSRLCYGTMTFGEQNSLSDSFRLLDKAFDSGINFFDSAEMYPVPQRAQTQGRSEEFLGRWIKDRNIDRDRIVLATKVTGPSGQMNWIRGGPHCLDSRNISEAIDNSLLRLQTDYIDLYQIHWPDRYVPMFGETEYDPEREYSSVPITEQLEALSKAIDAGKIRYIGLSNETPYGLMKFLQVAEKRESCHRIVSVQNAYSLLCRSFDSGLSECCHHERISLLAYSPLAMGILSGKYFAGDGGPPGARLNLFRGKYSEGESRYSLSKAVIREATLLITFAQLNPPSLSIQICNRSCQIASFPVFYVPGLNNVETRHDCDEYLEIARKFDIHPVSLALAFVLKHPHVASAVFGATNSQQLQEVLDACQVTIDDEVVSEINKAHLRFPNPCP